jgi:hypothetical protein
VHPNIFIIERGSDKGVGSEQSHHSALVELAKAKDYVLRDMTSLNAIFEKSR